MTDKSTVQQFYENRGSEASIRLNALRARSGRLSVYRFVVFFCGIAATLVCSWDSFFPAWTAIVAGLVFLIAFIALVIVHRRVHARISRETREVTICQEGVARIKRDWKSLKEIPAPPVEDEFGVGADLDLFGKISLYRLTGGAVTQLGQDTLASWLLTPSAPAKSAARSELVHELGNKRTDLMSFQHVTMDMDKSPLDPALFLAWAKGTPWLDSHRRILWVARALTPLPIILGICSAFGLLPAPFWIIAAAVNIAFSAFFVPKIHRVFEAVSMDKKRIDQYAKLFRFMAGWDVTSKRGQSIKEQLKANGVTAWRQMERLERIASFADLRLSGMTHFLVETFTLIDFHVLAWMESWQKQVGPNVEAWLTALGEFEAIMALALLAHDNPEYPVADVRESGPATFEAKGLGHPLIPADKLVANDVSLGPAGAFLLVTGSNMSGKTSLLRSIGLNIAMANAGGPVAAKELTLTPFALGTSFRITDSISDGISFFMAELKRLKQIVTRAEAVEPGEPPLVFLLDEILQGTNIVERRIAVAGVLKNLINLSCLGAISSHDLTLAEADEIGERAKPVYFTEQFRDGESGREMYFDYRLRSGVAPTTNALELLRLVGLEF